MKHIASITTLTLIAAAAMADAAPAVAPASAWTQSGNLAFTSDYIWRGLTQNNSQTAVQGGFDVAHTSGLSAGVWASNVSQTETSLELDVYANYGFKVAGIDASVGYIAYVYEGQSGLNFQEINVAATVAGITGKVSKEISNANNTGLGFTDYGYYYELNYSYNIPAVKDLVLGLHYGWADIKSEGTAEDYSIALSYPVAGFIATVSYSNTPGSHGVGQAYNAFADSATAVTLKKSF
jgi:uncharacterized protein (TIGR02001 family)